MDFRYLPGFKLPENVVAIPDLKSACEGASLLVFVLPHQVFLSFLSMADIDILVSWKGSGYNKTG